MKSFNVKSLPTLSIPLFSLYLYQKKYYLPFCLINSLSVLWLTMQKSQYLERCDLIPAITEISGSLKECSCQKLPCTRIFLSEKGTETKVSTLAELR